MLDALAGALGDYGGMDRTALIQACKNKDEEIKILKERVNKLTNPRMYQVMPERLASTASSLSGMFNDVFKNRSRHANSLYVLENDGLDEFIERYPDCFRLVTNATEQEFLEDWSVASALGAEKSVKIGVHLSGTGDVAPKTGFVGTRGESRQLEGFFVYECPFGLTLEYSAHLSQSGDASFVSSPQFIGTKGETRGLEGFTVRIVGENPEGYILTYMAHVAGFGDTAWVKEGCYCGTKGMWKSIEGLEIKIRPKHARD
jgi:hypothetical protein